MIDIDKKDTLLAEDRTNAEVLVEGGRSLGASNPERDPALWTWTLLDEGRGRGRARLSNPLMLSMADLLKRDN